MPRIHVARAFKLHLDATRSLAFEPGVHDVDEEVADHWYTREHLAPEGTPEPAGEAEDIDALRAERDALRAERDALLAEIAALKAEKDAPAEPQAGEGEAPATSAAETAAASPDASGGDGAPALSAVHRGRGSYAVMQGDQVAVDGLSKEDAEAFNALPAEEKAAFVAARKPA